MLSMDPYDIKKQLINLIDKRLGVQNVDTYEVGFLGYLTQAQTLLTSDVIYNNAMAYNEAFTQLLKLPTSLQNHANMLDYQLATAEPCSGYINIYVPYPQDTSLSYQLTLKNGTKCEGTVPYLIKDTYLISMPPITGDKRAKVQRRDATTGLITDVASYTELKDGEAA